jgi:hypothetical protein
MLQTVVFRGARNITGEVRVIHYREAGFDVADQAVMVTTRGEPVAVMLPGDTVELVEAVESLELAPAVASLTGTFVVGQDRIEPGQVSGEVSIDSGWRQTLLNRQHVITMDVTSAAGQFPAISLYRLTNPADTFYTLRSVLVTNPAATSFCVFELEGIPGFPISQTLPRSKLLGKSTGTRRLTALEHGPTTATPATLGSAPGIAQVRDLLFTSRPVAADIEVIRGSAPIIIASDQVIGGIAIIGGSANSRLVVNATYEISK